MAASGRALDIASVVVAGAGALILLGAFLPWITVTAPLVGTISRNGLDGGGDGLIAVVAGLALGAIGLSAIAAGGSTTHRVAAVVLGAVAVGLAILDYGNVQDRIRSLDTSIQTLGSVGTGLYAVGLGGLVAMVASVRMKRAKKAPQVSSA